MNLQLKDKNSIPEIIREMTLEEKALLVTGNSAFATFGIRRLGIPSATVLDGGTGVNLYQYFGDLCERVYQRDGAKGTSIGKKVSSSKMIHILENLDNPELLDEDHKKIYGIIKNEMKQIMPSEQMPGCFPPGILLGATWDKETVHLCAKAVAKEADAYKVDMLLGSPNVNIHRDPLNGRIFEGYSEDPCLTAQLAPEFVKGVQEEGLIANVKHFAANNQETHRQNINEQISERALYEIYFPGFKACVEEGKVKSIMSAYNKINGKACAMNSWLLDEVLRKEWGYKGMVVSDWGAVYDQVEAIKAGNDLDMPGKRDVTPIIQAVNSGTLSEEYLDKAVKNVLNMLLDMPVMSVRRQNQKINREYSKKAAFQAAAEGIVLLKNNRVLPLLPNEKVSFVGKKCLKFVESGGGSALVYTDQSTSLLEEARAIGAPKHILYGAIDDDSKCVVITVSAQGQEGTDRPEMDIDSEEKEILIKTLKAAKKMAKKTVVILNVAGPVDLTEYIEYTDALLCVFFPGMEGGRAVAKILYGELNPSGKLPITFPKKYKDCPTYGNFPGCAGEVYYGEGIFVGYRYYEYKEVEPMYPFGFGLSYTNFDITNARISKSIMNLDESDSIEVNVDVKNTGLRKGKEVVQLYVQDPVSTLVKPVKELKAFQKIELEPGEQKTLTFLVTKELLASFDTEYHMWESEAGVYKILLGNASNNITASCEFIAKGCTIYNYNENTMLERIVKDSRAYEILISFLRHHEADISMLEEYLIFFPHVPLSKMLLVLLSEKLPDVNERNQVFEDVYQKLHELELSGLSTL